MKNRLVGILAAVLGCATIAMASDPIEVPDPLIADGYTGVEEAPFSCGTRCNGVWKHVVTCYGNQTCCGYYYCSNGHGQGTCCNPGQSCSWNGVGTPGAIYCIAHP